MFLELLQQRTEKTWGFSLTPPSHLDLNAAEENSFNEELWGKMWLKAILVAFTASAAVVALCQCERFCGSCTWQSPVLQNVISLTHFWAGSDPCSILRCWLSVWRALSVWEAICEKSPAGFRGKLITVLPYLHGIRGGLFPYDVDAPVVCVLHSSFPPQGLCRFLMCHWKLLASFCLGAPADQRGHISDLFWVSVCLCHLLLVPPPARMSKVAPVHFAALYALCSIPDCCAILLSSVVRGSSHHS